jgi:hypothetical protein
MSSNGWSRKFLEHDPEKCEAVFRKDHAQTKRDDDSSQSHRAFRSSLTKSIQAKQLAGGVLIAPMKGVSAWPGISSSP